LRAAAQARTRRNGVVAVSLPGEEWALVNITPGVAGQLETDARLLAHAGLVDPRRRNVLLTDAQIEHVTGLLSLREGPPIHLYATPAVFEELTHNIPVLPTLEHYCGVHWHVIPVAGECSEACFEVDGLPGIEFTAIATDEALPPHAARVGAPTAGDSIALALRNRDGGQRLLCTGDLSAAGAAVVDWMDAADCVLVGDAHCHDLAAGAATAQRLGTLQRLALTAARRKLLLCRPGEPQRGELPLSRSLASQGIELAVDRMEIVL
jgi:pyrroloquinoline quinone biosynthesis protein B